MFSTRRSLLVSTRLLVSGAVTLGLIYWVYVTIGWVGLRDTVVRIPASELLIVVPGIILSHLLRSMRLILCYRKFNGSMREVAGIGFIHNCLNFWLPMRLGELALPFLSKSRLGITYTDSTLTLVYLRMLDVHVLLLLVMYFVGDVFLERRYYWVTLGCLAAVPLLLYVNQLLTHRVRLSARLSSIVGSFGYWVTAYVLTIGVWVSKIGALSYLALGISDIDINHAWVATIVADASSLSPITGLANSGTFEAGFVFPLMFFGYGQEATLGVAIALHLVLGFVSLLMGTIGVVLLFDRFRQTLRGPAR